MGRSKPSPHVYLEAAKRLGVPPSACIAVENEADGIASAKAAGMRCIGVKICATEELNADIIIESLEKFEVDML